LANAQRRKCGRSLLYCFLSDPFGIGYFEIRVLQFQFVR
jgi:hypothetical protein